MRVRDFEINAFISSRFPPSSRILFKPFVVIKSAARRICETGKGKIRAITRLRCGLKRVGKHKAYKKRKETVERLAKRF